MKIINWNCGGAFRKKIEPVLKFEADIYIIQECEHPEKFIKISALKHFKYFWKGSNQNKGLAIFYKANINIVPIEMDETFRSRQLQWFLPVSVNDSFEIIAVWTHKADAEAFAYIGQFYWYLENNLNKFSKPIFVGDFNSNTIWDSWDRWWNHSDIVETLKNQEINSLYHFWKKEKQGAEITNTFHHRKDINKGYHIDYIFAKNNFLNDTESFEIGKPEEWMKYSDHIPLVWIFRTPKKKDVF